MIDDHRGPPAPLRNRRSTRQTTFSAPTRSWVAPRAADFAARAAVVLDLYAGSYDDQPLGDGDFVLRG
jgi:hypothetical protein